MMGRRVAALATALGAVEAARRPGTVWSATLGADGDAAALHGLCAGLSQDLAWQVLDHAPATYHIASASSSASVALWSSEGGVGVLAGHSAEVLGLELFPSGDRALTWGRDGIAIVWDMSSKQALATLRPPGPVELARFFPDGRRVLTCAAGAFCMVWDMETSQPLCEIGVPRQRGARQPATLADLIIGRAEVLAPGDRVFTFVQRVQAKIWDVPSGRERCVLRGEDVSVAKPFPDGARLLTGSYEDRQASIWDAYSCEVLLQLAHSDWLVDVAVLGPSALTMDVHGLVSVWSAATGALRRTLHAPGQPWLDPIYGLWPFPDGHRLATVYLQSVLIWNATTGVALHRLQHDGVHSLAVAPAGDRLATCAGWRVALWDTRTGAEQRLAGGARGRRRAPGMDRCVVAMAWGAVLGGGVPGPSWRSLEPL